MLYNTVPYPQLTLGYLQLVTIQAINQCPGPPYQTIDSQGGIRGMGTRIQHTSPGSYRLYGVSPAATCALCGLTCCTYSSLTSHMS